MIVNYCFHVSVFGATMADLDAVSVEDLVEAVVLRKCLSSRFKKCLPIFVDTFLLKGELNQIIFLLWLRLLWVFALTGLCFNRVDRVVHCLKMRLWFLKRKYLEKLIDNKMKKVRFFLLIYKIKSVRKQYRL